MRRTKSTENNGNDIWPLPSYNPGERLHLHALGVISITYAAFERNVDNFYEFHSKASDIEEFFGLSIKRRISAIRDIYLKCDSAETRTAVDNLLTYFDQCSFNRNGELCAAGIAYRVEQGKKHLKVNWMTNGRHEAEIIPISGGFRYRSYKNSRANIRRKMREMKKQIELQ